MDSYYMISGIIAYCLRETFTIDGGGLQWERSDKDFFCSANFGCPRLQSSRHLSLELARGRRRVSVLSNIASISCRLGAAPCQVRSALGSECCNQNK